MIVFMPKNLVFLSVPKTGTTAYVNALRPRASVIISDPPGLKHTNLAKFQRQFLPILQKSSKSALETMAVVREPLDWLGSWYRYRQRPKLDGHENSTKGISFDEFISSYLRGDKPKFAQVGDIAKFVKPAQGQSELTHLFKYEAQDRVHSFLQDRLELELSLEQRNVSPKIPLEIEPKTLEKLKRKCADQFAIWEKATG